MTCKFNKNKKEEFTCYSSLQYLCGKEVKSYFIDFLIKTTILLLI